MSCPCWKSDYVLATKLIVFVLCYLTPRLPCNVCFFVCYFSFSLSYLSSGFFTLNCSTNILLHSAIFPTLTLSIPLYP
ncbi:hypothetical protein B9Z19DRAFT_246371 [Tuber borchii]|uniref:Uncharacterized protein n=1 Tax=Tuber borchii TaxID=42251 RepID=A0A2T6ZM30_TUBBO|nr:hypothetical protein B9Z19DRAFT_246371 [Tuber borchii]